MVGRDPEADQAVGHRVAVEDVDASLIAIGLFQRFGGVEARRSRPDNREMPHAPSLVAAGITKTGPHPTPLPLAGEGGMPRSGRRVRVLSGMILQQDAALP